MIETVVVAVAILIRVASAGDPFWRGPLSGNGWATVETVDTHDLDGDYQAAICATLRCGKGEECVFEGRVAVCKCRRTCPHTDRPVCGTDALTYPSHCHLHREACLTGKKLHALRHGPCTELTNHRVLPVLFTNASKDNATSTATTSSYWTTSTSTSTLDPQPQEQLVWTPVATTSQSPSSLATTAGPTCSDDDFLYVPSNLLLYFHAKYAHDGSGEPSEKGKSYLVHLIYNHLDLNADRILTEDELEQLESEGKYVKLMPAGCHLTDLLVHADSDGDGRLNEREFFRLFGLPVAFISPHNEIKVHQVEVGQQYQLFCDIEKYNSASLKVTWYRYDAPLVNVAPYDFEVSADGSLYLTPASLTHNGNFSCRVPISVTNGGSSGSDLPNVLQQIHLVNVFDPVRVSVSPDFLLMKTGENGYLQCDVEGYPTRKITWDKNGRPFRENVSLLQLSNARSYDTGSYRCTVSSGAHVDNVANGGNFSYRSASVVVRDHYDQPEMAIRFNTRHRADSFLILYESGVRVFRADDCTLLHSIPASYPVTEEKQGYLCRDRRCHWSDGVLTQPPVYLYATLPQQMALVKINVTSGTVEEFFHLNHTPMKLRYMEWEDSVWVESWHGPDGNYKTIQTIRSASKRMRHSLTHALPLRDEFDAVKHVFLPTYGNLKYGYVSHWRERALHKIDLHSLKIVSRVSLVPYDCEPNEVAFVAQVGLAVVQCSPSTPSTGNRTSSGGQLILDYISDATLGYHPDTHGKPVVTEDGRWIINIDSVLGRIFVHGVDETGGPLVATIDEFLPINDWAVHPAVTFGSWDIYAASKSGNNLIKISIPEAKMDRVSVIGNGNQEKPVVLVSTERRGRYLVGASSESVFTMDLFNSGNTNCHVPLNGTQKVVWLN